MSRPYFECRTCGFRRSHRYASGGFDGFLAKWRVQFHVLWTGHRPGAQVQRSNCLIFALERVWKRGGYLVMQRSSYGWWPHFIWSADLNTFEEFIPTGPRVHRRCPPIVFVGHVRTWSKKR